jgi:hypothetical protein
MHQQYRDAEDIRDDDWLLRRITPSQHVEVQPDGTRVLTSFAFREQSHEFSLYVAREITHEKLLSCGFPTQEIVEVKAEEVRALGYIIVRDPDDCDDSHVFAKAVRHKSRTQVKRDCQTLAEAVTRRWAERRRQTAPAPDE